MLKRASLHFLKNENPLGGVNVGMVKQRLSLVTLGVGDVAKSRAFYERLGFVAEPFDSEDVAFFDMNGTVFGLYGRDALARDAGVQSQGSGFRSGSLGINLESESEVDQTLQEAEAAGAVITKPAEKVFWGGYSGYFQDPDGHLWEVSYNPFWSFDDAGRVILPSKQSPRTSS